MAQWQRSHRYDALQRLPRFRERRQSAVHGERCFAEPGKRFEAKSAGKFWRILLTAS
jgi:hypothetical protein